MLERIASVFSDPGQWASFAVCCTCMGFVFARYKAIGIASSLFFVVILISMLGLLQPLSRLQQDNTYNFTLLGFFVIGLVAGSIQSLLRFFEQRRDDYLTPQAPRWRGPFARVFRRESKAMRRIRAVQESMKSRERREAEAAKKQKDRQYWEWAVASANRAAGKGRYGPGGKWYDDPGEAAVAEHREEVLKQQERERQAQESQRARAASSEEARRRSERFRQATDDEDTTSTSSRPASGSSNSSPRRRSAYEILGVQPGAASADIKAAYRREANRYAPDKYEHMSEAFRKEASDELVKINKAYEKLRANM